MMNLCILCIQIGATAFIIACQEGHIEVIQLLLDHGAEFGVQEKVCNIGLY